MSKRAATTPSKSAPKKRQTFSNTEPVPGSVPVPVAMPVLLPLPVAVPDPALGVAKLRFFRGGDAEKGVSPVQVGMARVVVPLEADMKTALTKTQYPPPNLVTGFATATAKVTG